MLGLVSTLIIATAPVNGVDASAAFERLNHLEGTWRSKDTHFITLRVLASGSAVVETVSSGKGQTFDWLVVYRLEGRELTATVDGALHAVLKLTNVSPSSLTFEGPFKLVLSLGATGEYLRSMSKRAGATDETVTLTREYLDTLK